MRCAVTGFQNISIRERLTKAVCLSFAIGKNEGSLEPL